MSEKAVELLPCPFCGDAMELRGDYTPEQGWNFFEHANAIDSNCLIKDHRINAPDFRTPDPKEANEWNKRAAPHLTTQGVGEEKRTALDTADALEKCDWSGCSIGNKAILQAAIDSLRTLASPARQVVEGDEDDDLVEQALAVNSDDPAYRREHFKAILAASFNRGTTYVRPVSDQEIRERVARIVCCGEHDCECILADCEAAEAEHTACIALKYNGETVDKLLALLPLLKREGEGK